MSQLENEIREWQQKELDNYCKVCKDNCCNLNKHVLTMGNNNLSLFEEKRIPVYKSNQFKNLYSRKKNKKLILKDGSQVPELLIIELTHGDYGWFLKGDACPFYNPKKGCEVHEDSRRPSCCRDYPLEFLGYNEFTGKILDVRILNTCEYFRKDDVKSALVEKFPVRIIH
ncbi:MAG: YkgJ family cysteine cluster protein [Candidatus Pacearchaeota archaeon]|nr:YkgJ family cysteine cluster protein [Candidatus Pacearchaeota archaeon]